MSPRSSSYSSNKVAPGDGGSGAPLSQPEPLLFCIDARGWTIRSQIMTGILLVAAAILVSVTAASVINVLVLGGATSQKATTALETQIRTNALNFSVANAQQIRHTLLRRAALTDMLAIAMGQMLAADPRLLGNATESLWFEDVCDAPGAVAKTPGDSLVCKTREMSVYYLPRTRKEAAAAPCGHQVDDPAPQLGYDMRLGGCAALAERLDATCPCPCVGDGCSDTISTAARTERDVSAHLDRHFKSFASSMADVSLMYVGFEATGLFRQYPAANDLPHAMTYDPRKRPWYVQAREAPTERTLSGHNMGKTIVSAPYLGASDRVLMVTVAKAVYAHDNPGKLRCVIGVDITLGAIQENLQRHVHFLSTGYVALVESRSRDKANPRARMVVAHKAYDSEAYGDIVSKRKSPILDIADVEPAVVSNTTLFGEIWDNDSHAIRDYERDGTRFLLAHSSITDPSPLTVLIFIPESEALAAVPALENKIHATEVEVISSVMLVSLATGVVVFLAVGQISLHISSPVASMVTVAHAIVGGAAELDFGKNVTAQHMERLKRCAFPDNNSLGPQEEVRNEMVLLSRSFLEMTQGLKQDTDKSKQRIVQPQNEFHVAREHALVSDLHRHLQSIK